jgi:hypothetical protein
MPKNKLTVSSGEIRMRIGHPIETENCSLKDRESLMQNVSEKISKDFQLISSLNS